VLTDIVKEPAGIDETAEMTYVRASPFPGGAVSQRSNAEIIRIVEKYQEAGIVHELTCRIDSRHVALAPVVMDGKVVLLCPTCRSIQEHIPADARAEDDLRRRRSDVWWTVAVLMTMCTFLPGLVWGTYAMLAGFLASALGMGIYARRRFRAIESGAPDEEET
jgi:hypothetical protein